MELDKIKWIDDKIFNVFEMEMNYLSEIAWEGLKCGQAIISCEIQQSVLNMIKYKYLRKDISVNNNWMMLLNCSWIELLEKMKVFI
ncbi:hypothetical protein RFI_36802 [Reticulomyxa filosa]|uniref:Uncharacterized protein n=1 Tax=Reticulomyxa filosa TaxID=46433 RepID=X6LF63_RETFI|nr:hypothetical protein RFI_36802 [Reticulomyxa filosa]|eukprot:ETO00638.1 hypothetical protein RFI_36802 [Reticulomyxa filosa]